MSRSAAYAGEMVLAKRSMVSSVVRGAGIGSGYNARVQQPPWNYEQEPRNEPGDETTINLRAYFDRMPDEIIRAYDPAWSDEQLIAWCGDFRDDGVLFLPCSERDVGVAEFRRELEGARAYRARVRRS
jgi:hypothetical protein